jgi:hypothetical protein
MELQTLLAREALRDLTARYCRAVDRRDFALVRSLYHDDAVHDHGAMFQGGPDAFVAWLGGAMGDIVTHHFIGNALFAIGGDEAEGEVYTINYHIIGGARDYIAGGRYLDHYVRQDGRWLFKARKRVLDWTHERETKAGQTGAGVARGAFGADDASYVLTPRIAAAKD